jgi:hypothetical protein
VLIQSQDEESSKPEPNLRKVSTRIVIKSYLEGDFFLEEEKFK